MSTSPTLACSWTLLKSYDNKINASCEEVMTGLYACIERLVPDSSIQDKITTELATYQMQKLYLVIKWQSGKGRQKHQVRLNVNYIILIL